MDGVNCYHKGRSSYARVMIELRADVELKDNIVVAMPKTTREGHYTCNVRVEYKWKPPRCLSCKIFGHIHKECPKNTGAGEKKTVKKPSQTSQGILVGSKIGFKHHKEYQPILKKSTASSSDNKKNGAEPTIEGTTNLVNNRATSSGSSFINVDNSSSGTTPIIDKIKKFEDLLTSGQAILVDEVGNPLKKVEFLGKYDSEDEVASVDNDMARSMAYERVGFGTQSLPEQWKDSYGNDDYDDDPYDDDMHDGQDLSHELHTICDNLDIRTSILFHGLVLVLKDLCCDVLVRIALLLKDLHMEINEETRKDLVSIIKDLDAILLKVLQYKSWSQSSSFDFIDEQLSTLISFTKDNSLNIKNVHANMAVFDGKVVDLGANQPMTHTDKELDNVYDISHLRIKVGHLDGTEAFIFKIENLRLSNGLVMYDMLVIPKYCVTLISVHKLAKDNNICIAFEDSKCFFLNKDLNPKNVLRIGNQCEGLYYFNNQDPVLKHSLQFNNKNQTVFYEICQRTKHSREQFSLSDHTSKVLGDLVHLDLWDPYKHSSVPGEEVNTIDFPSGNFGNDAQSSDDIFAAQDQQFMHSSLKSHLRIAFKILRYLKGSLGLSVHILKDACMILKAYSDADWANYYRAISERWRKERVLEHKRRSLRKSTEFEEYDVSF
ncbi:RNA-directed DNA polymerase, eukaryota, reverse transcriptase zinc-binding domain protein [Tanacetum coccineum]